MPAFVTRPAPEGALSPLEYLAVDARTGVEKWCSGEPITNAKAETTGYLVRLGWGTQPYKFDWRGRGTKGALFWSLVVEGVPAAEVAKAHLADLSGAYGRPARRGRARKVDPRQVSLLDPAPKPLEPDTARDDDLDPFSDIEWEFL